MKVVIDELSFPEWVKTLIFFIGIPCYGHGNLALNSDLKLEWSGLWAMRLNPYSGPKIFVKLF